MKLGNYTFILAAFLATAAVPSASKLATAPLGVLLSVTDDQTSIKANVTNLDVQVSSDIALFEFCKLILPSRKSMS
jgi:hypothetical protein